MAADCKAPLCQRRSNQTSNTTIAPTAAPTPLPTTAVEEFTGVLGLDPVHFGLIVGVMVLACLGWLRVCCLLSQRRTRSDSGNDNEAELYGVGIDINTVATEGQGGGGGKSGLARMSVGDRTPMRTHTKRCRWRQCLFVVQGHLLLLHCRERGSKKRQERRVLRTMT